MCIGVTRLISSKGINQWNYTISYKFTTKYDTKWNICLKQESGLIKVKRNVKLYCSPQSLKPCSDIDWLGIVKSLRLHQDLSMSTIYFFTEGGGSQTEVIVHCHDTMIHWHLKVCIYTFICSVIRFHRLKQDGANLLISLLSLILSRSPWHFKLQSWSAS